MNARRPATIRGEAEKPGDDAPGFSIT